MSAETRAYLNTDLTSFVDYLTTKYNLATENFSNITAEDRNYIPVYGEVIPSIRDEFTGELKKQLLRYNNSSIG